jgi:hypothetical protein
MKICPVGAVLFHAGGRKDGMTERQTDMAKLTIAMRNSAKGPKNTTSGHPTHFPLGLFFNAA